MKWLDRRIAKPGPYLTLCLSKEEYIQAAKHCKVEYPDPWILGETSDATTHVFYNDEYGLITVVCLKLTGDLTAIEIAGLLIHEAVHCWQRYADSIGEASPGREQEAYAIQSISIELLDEYARRLG